MTLPQLATRHDEWDDPTPSAPAQDSEPDDPTDEIGPVLPSLGLTPERFAELCGRDLRVHPVLPLASLNHRPAFVEPDAETATRGEPVTVRLPEACARMIDVLVHSQETPYRTRSDFLRDAAFHLAYALVEAHQINDPRLKSYLITAQQAADAAFMARIREQVRQAEHDLTDYLLAVLERGDLPEAYRVIQKRLNEVGRIPVDHWRNLWLDMLRTNPLVALLLTLSKSGPGGTQSPGVS